MHVASIQAIDQGQQVGKRSGAGQALQIGAEASVARRLQLVAHVDLGRRIIADQHNARAPADARRAT